jgi:neuropeptide Y receptor
MRTARNFFILNLALSDFFICIITAPTTLYTVLYMFWPYGKPLCKIAGSLQGFNIFLSTFSITAIALDRYVLVIFPTKRERQHNLSLIFFILIWIISFLLALPLLDASDLNVLFQDKNCGITLTICHEKNEHWQKVRINL